MSTAWRGRRLEAGSFGDALQKLGPPASLFLAGPEVLLRDEILGQIRVAVLGTLEGGRWNREVYSAREIPLSEIVGGLRVVGLFAETRLVIVGEVERYGRCSQADRADLWQWMERPSPGIHLVLTSEKPLWELERGNEFLKGTLQRVDALVRLDHPSYETAVQLVIKVAREHYDLDLPEAPARRLVDAVGPNLLGLRQELERLTLRLGAGGRVDEGTLENWLRGGVVGSLGDLEAALLAGDRAKALRYWAAVRRSFNAPTVTWMIGSRHLDPRWSRQGRERSPSGSLLSRILHECYRLERAVKMGEIPSSLQETAFEAMVWRLCQRQRAASSK